MAKSDSDVGTGLVGAPACGDVMKLQIRVDPTNNTISDVKFKTFGCGSAIASSSYLTELVRGMTLEDAGKIRNTEIAQELCLPPVKRELVFYLNPFWDYHIPLSTTATLTPTPPPKSPPSNPTTANQPPFPLGFDPHSPLLHARRRCHQIRHLKLLHQEPQSPHHRPFRHCIRPPENRSRFRTAASCYVD